MAIQHLSHIGLCVTDVERSIRFYCDALGFEEMGELTTRGQEAAQLLGMDAVELRAVYLDRDGVRIELLGFGEATEAAKAEPRPMPRPGFTHFSLRVDDLEAAIAAIEKAGGRALPETRIEVGGVTKVIFALDPDSTRIELIEAPGDPTALPAIPKT